MYQHQTTFPSQINNSENRSLFNLVHGYNPSQKGSMINTQVSQSSYNKGISTNQNSNKLLASSHSAGSANQFSLISISNIECLKSHKTPEHQDSSNVSDDSASTKDSEEHLEESARRTGSQKKSYKKAPQGKMDDSDEELLLSLASKYKHDWKKVSKKIFKLNKKKLGPNLLRIRYKELAPDLTQKRVRFTHKEDLMIVKYYSQYGYDWEKIAGHFESRTAIMVKNRFYHIKKKNILEKLLEEVDSIETSSSVQVDNLGEEAEVEVEIAKEEEVSLDEGDRESLQFFVQKGEELFSKTLKFSPIDNFFNMGGIEQEFQLFEKITPLTSLDRKEYRYEEEDIYSLTSFMGRNSRQIYY